jgi:pyruvate,water dikinase
MDIEWAHDGIDGELYVGIDSMSLTPDSVLRTMRAVLERERRLGRPARSEPAAG